MPSGLRARLALQAALLLCLIQIVLGVVFYASTARWLLEQLDRSLSTTALQAAATISDGDPLEEDDYTFLPVEAGRLSASIPPEQQFFIRIIDQSSGEVLGASAAHDVAVSAAARSNRPSFETMTAAGGGASVRVYTLPLSTNPGLALQVGHSLYELQQTQRQIVRLLLLLLLATALLALLSGWFLARQALRPVQAITRIARVISERDLSRRIDLELPNDELGELALTFNGMLERIEVAFRLQRQFTADAAHELRTPLSAMQTGIDVALSRPRSAESYRSLLEAMREEVMRLGQLAAHLLSFARAEDQTIPFELRRMDLSLLLQSVVEPMDAAAGAREITLEYEPTPPIFVNGDADALTRLILNLLENALKYTPRGGSIALKLEQAGSSVRLTVADTGLGIPAEHLAHLFERFYRVNKARSRQDGGLGLGLAIARQIALRHGGEIAVTSEPEIGSVFTVTLPAA